MELRFKVDKATKNTVRYEEVPEEGKPPIVGTIYVQKWYLGNPAPVELRITIEK
jgi:hypothetical protein